MQDLPPSASWGVFLCERDTMMCYPGWIRTHLRSPALGPCVVSMNAFCAVFLGCPWVTAIGPILNTKFCRNWHHCFWSDKKEKVYMFNLCTVLLLVFICFVVFLFLFFLYSFITGGLSLWTQSVAGMEDWPYFLPLTLKYRSEFRLFSYYFLINFTF